MLRFLTNFWPKPTKVKVDKTHSFFKEMLRFFYFNPAALYGILVAAAALIYIQIYLPSPDHPSESCEHLKIIKCISYNYEHHFHDRVLISIIVFLDAAFILFVSIVFCANYSKILDHLRHSFLKERYADLLWCKYRIGSHAALSATILALMLFLWAEGFWLAFPLLLFSLYVIFLHSNGAIARLMTERFRYRKATTRTYEELFFDNISIATKENLPALRGYSILFMFAALPYMYGIIVDGGETIAEIMKGFLAGAALVHLSLSALKFRSIIDDIDSTTMLIAADERVGYRIMPVDKIFRHGTGLPNRIKIVTNRWLLATIIVMIAVGTVHDKFGRKLTVSTATQASESSGGSPPQVPLVPKSIIPDNIAPDGISSTPRSDIIPQPEIPSISSQAQSVTAPVDPQLQSTTTTTPADPQSTTTITPTDPQLQSVTTTPPADTQLQPTVPPDNPRPQLTTRTEAPSVASTRPSRSKKRCRTSR